jgi:hypothetical protein
MKDFILYPEALALKELGFDEPCLSSFDENKNLFKVWENDMVNGRTICLAPLYQQAFKWFREKYNLHALIMPKTTPSNTTVYYIYKGKFEENWDNCFEAYEEAELRCLKHLIKTVKENENQI